MLLLLLYCILIIMGNSHKSDKGLVKQAKVEADPNFGNALMMKKFTKISVVGRGGFGKVWKVQNKKNHKYFAMKEMSKAKVIVKKSVESVLNQLNLLKCLKNDFLINASNAFQDRENLYLTMDLLTGGDLRFHLLKNTKFNEEQTKFFTACILIALQFLHINGIIHRDLKPQNIVFDKKGYLRLTDLGVARIWKPQNACDTSGTPGYMAPQVMCRCNHGVAADYYALGVIVHQCMLGYRPYIGANRQQIRDKILSRQVQVKIQQLPKNWSPDALDFINKSIQRKPNSRLGNNGPQQIMNHPWLKSIDWSRLKRKSLPSPFTPIYNAQQYQDQLNAIVDVVIPVQTTLLLRKQAIQNMFFEYQYDGSNTQNPLLQNVISNI